MIKKMLRGMKKYWKITLGVVAVSVIVSLATDDKVEDKTEDISAKEVVETKVDVPKSTDEKLEDMFKRKHNVKNIKSVDDIVIIDAELSSLTRSRSLLSDYAEMIFELSEINKVILNVSREGTDSKGHEVNINAYNGEMDRGTFEELNVDNLMPEQFAQHVTESIHPIWVK